jgi:SAM-dependent methyltransferase
MDEVTPAGSQAAVPAKQDAAPPGSRPAVPIPPRFDPAYYRRENPDLGLSDDKAASLHYVTAGRAEGRAASPFAFRERLIAEIGDGRSVLEIGPFCRPLLRGANVEYFDVLDADGLRQRATALGIDPRDCPERIHHVGDLGQVDGRYDAVVSSHAVEHQPDLVSHLEQVSRVLAPGGQYFLMIPDKRYCLDHFLPESGIAQILQAHEDKRTIHSLASVVEHSAMVTHNDPVRHWRGDHGEPSPRDRTRRIRQAIAHHTASENGYVDVHAWQFTPDSFADIIAALGELGLIRLDLVGVYDTPRDRAEFCAVLQLRRPARPRPTRNPGIDIVVFQTADPFKYSRMLASTAPTVVEFCRRHSLRYESFVGIRRGFWSWQAAYNRILMLGDLIDRGFTGWALYLDADAYINDLDFDLAGYLADKQEKAAILATSGVTGEHWDINSGVVLVNFGHPQGRRLVERWRRDFLALPDDWLRQTTQWPRGGNDDQDLIHQILKSDPAIADAVLVESLDFMNSRHARFIRQHLRAQTGDIDTRIRSIAAEVYAIFQRDGAAPAALLDGPPVTTERESRMLHHPVGLEPQLVGSGDAVPLPALAERAIAAWHAVPGRPEAPRPQADFAAILDRRDADAMAVHMAQLGRVRVSQGFFGGLRQHRRAATDPAFGYRRALRTYDALVSLAEAVGVLPLENPELGPWGENVQIGAEVLWQRLSEALAIDLAPPPHIGGYLGIAVGGSVVLHLRIVEAIYAAWRLRQLADLRGGARICHIGGGAGLTAFYARRLGLSEYLLADTPIMNAIQAYVLGEPAGRPDLALAGERAQDGATQRILPLSALSALAPGSFDVLFNEDSLFEMAEEDAVTILAQARRLRIPAILSFNQEATATGETPRATIATRVARAGGYRRVQRQRHGLRAGFAEELFLAGE